MTTKGNPVTRRDLLRMAAASPVLALRAGRAHASGPASSLNLQSFAKAPGRIVRADGAAAGSGLRLDRTWEGPLCRSRAVNETGEPVRIREVVLFDVTISSERLDMLRKLQPPTGRAARFADESLRVGIMDLPGQRAFCLLNWDDAPRTLSCSVAGPHHIRELWTGEDRGRHAGGAVALDLPARSGRVLLCSPA